MKVSELVDKLQKMPNGAYVHICNIAISDDDGWCPLFNIDDIEVRTAERGLHVVISFTDNIYIDTEFQLK